MYLYSSILLKNINITALGNLTSNLSLFSLYRLFIIYYIYHISHFPHNSEMSGILKNESSFFPIFSRFLDSVYMSKNIWYNPYGILHYLYTIIMYSSLSLFNKKENCAVLVSLDFYVISFLLFSAFFSVIHLRTPRSHLFLRHSRFRWTRVILRHTGCYHHP